MRLIALNYSKINVEKFSNKFRDLKIGTSINLDSIKKTKNEFLKTKDFFLDIKFNYILEYTPKIAKIELEGNILISVDPKKGEEILKDWKNKKLDDETRLVIFNSILSKANIKAIQLEEEFTLPIHFKLPSLKVSKKEEPSK